MDYMAAHHVMTLCTHGPDGPWAAPVFYAASGLTLYFVSNPETRHGRNIGAAAPVAAAITEDYDQWQEIQGLQLEGRCRRLTGEEQAAARAIFLARYPFAAAFLDPAGPMYERAGRTAAFYCLQPRRCCFVNNPAGFGRRECWDL